MAVFVLGIFLIRGLAIITVARFKLCFGETLMLAASFDYGLKTSGNESYIDVQILCNWKLEIGDRDLGYSNVDWLETTHHGS